MGGVALALLASLAAVAISSGSSGRMGYLYTDLDPSAAQTIAEKLRSQNVPFSLSGDGTAILAPEDRLAELRMGMAGEQLGGKIGYEVLDEEQPFGISSSREKLNETRAIEGELARSIATLQNIAAARVHIVMPERALFATEPREASASITVRTRGKLSAGNVEAIRYLVASAVPELSPEAVSIVDQTGTLLARAGDPGEAGAGQADERQVAVEARIRREVESLLEPIVGAGKVRAEVAAEIDRDQTREEAQIYDPDTQVIARQVMVESDDQSRENQAGAQGATVAAQLPEGQGEIEGADGETRESARNEISEDTTYQNSSRHTVTTRAPGTVTRLTVAVMLDSGEQPIPAEQIQRLTRLVENAVGFDASRGDSVIVESMAFAQPEEIADSAGLLSALPMDRIFDVGKLLLIAIVGLIALRMLKPKQAGADIPARIGGPDREPIELTPMKTDQDSGEPAAIEGPELDDEIARAQVEGNIRASALRKISDAISASPAEAASVVRQWMNA